jgi:hypothetical protein
MSAGKLIAAAVGGLGLCIVTSVGASADVVCSGNVCWHAHDRFHYPREAGVVVHRDNWRAGPGIEFREHEGRGYWRGGDWVGW